MTAALPAASRPEPTRAELKMRSAAYNWFTRHRLRVLEADVDRFVYDLLLIADPPPRPVDVEQPRVPKGAAARAAAIRARQAELPPEPKPVAAPKPKPAPAPLPPLPERLDDELRAVVGLIGLGFSNAAIGGRLGISEQRVKYAVTRAKQRLGVTDRKLLAVALAEVLALSEGDAGATVGAACPPVASNVPDRARGASEPQRPAEGPFWPIASASSAEESPAMDPGDAPDALVEPGSPSGPPRPAAGGTEPHSAIAATEAVQR